MDPAEGSRDPGHGSRVRVVWNRSGAIRTNPVADTKAPRKPHQEMVFLTAEEIIAVATEITSPPIKTGGGEHRRRSFPDRGLLVRLAGFTGLRAGEITALKVSALDLTTMHVRVPLAAIHLPIDSIAAAWAPCRPSSAVGA